jgi:transcriptional regulator with XRE-family HTH domain
MSSDFYGFGGIYMNTNRLREERQRRRVTQFQLRIASGVHQSKISLIENGWIEPRDDEQRRLAKALSVKPEEIFGIGN